MSNKELIELADAYGAHNYHPLPVVVAKANGVWVEDADGKRYMDCLAAYSAINFGHSNPELIAAAKAQLDRVTLTSRAFHNDQLGPFCKALADLTGMDTVLPMNTGAEAVETAIKTARKWAYKVKRVPENQAKIIVCSGNFHGRTTPIVSFSTDPQARGDYGPYTPGFEVIPYGDAKAMARAIDANTAAFLVEPIQGEAGIVMPPDGYLREVRRLCTEKNVLFIADEVQTGLGRTGRTFACEWEDVKPDMFVLGKALGGGIVPISAVAAKKEILGVFRPGDHGSTFGGNPLACAVARRAIALLEKGEIQARAAELGRYLLESLKKKSFKCVKELRGRGLFIGVEIDTKFGPARPYCERLMAEGMLCKETHDQVIRLAPPLVITKDEIDWMLERLTKVLS